MISSLRFVSSPCLPRVVLVDDSVCLLLRLTQRQACVMCFRSAVFCATGCCRFLYCLLTNGTFVTMAGTAWLRIITFTVVPSSICSVGT